MHWNVWELLIQQLFNLFDVYSNNNNNNNEMQICDIDFVTGALPPFCFVYINISLDSRFKISFK